MNRIEQLLQRKQSDDPRQKGQSIVLIALMMIAIIAFVGIAVDVGFIFARGSQLQAAIDSAALAGVVELTGWTEGNTALENDARTKSAQFLNANHMPISVTTSLNDPGNVQVQTTPLGATQYAVTATWPVETFFLKVIGFREPINLTRSATAAVFALADIYASRRVEDGVLSTSNQAIFGPNICVNYGDPFSPWSSPFEPNSYTYQYRILVPEDYPEDILRVELFDPDSINAPGNDHDISRSNIAIFNLQNPGANKDCGPDGGSSNQKQPCLLRTDEKNLVTGAPFLDIDQVNPYWFVRIDENRGAGSGNGNNTCGEPTNYTTRYNTRTEFLLYYFRQNANGTIERIDLVSYYGQTGDGVRDNGDHNTDMRWVSPGADVSFGYDYDPNPNGPDVPATEIQIDSFEIDLTQDVPGIVRDQSSNARYIFIDVTTLSGSSENGFEIWAGPNYVDSVPSDVNLRNLHVLNNPGSHSSKGATVFGLGNLPMNSNYADNGLDINPVNIPLMYVSPQMTGQTIEISMFDSDAGARPPVIFFFDSIAFTPDDGSDLGYNPAGTDWAMAFGVSGQDDPDGVAEGVRCRPGSCQANGSVSGPNSGWVTPAYQIEVPGDLEDCDYSNPNMFDCTPFYGGILTARYTGGQNDTYGWQIRIEGLPYLVK